MKELISEYLNIILNKKNKYKCVAYINDGLLKDNIAETFELDEYSMRKAYKKAYEIIRLKYGRMGVDLRVFNSVK